MSAPTRHFVDGLVLVLSKVWFLIVKYIVFEAYLLLAPKCRVGALVVGALVGAVTSIHDFILFFHAGLSFTISQFF